MSTDVESIGTSAQTKARQSSRANAFAFAHNHPLIVVAFVAGVTRFISTFIAAKYFSGSYVFDDGTYFMMAEAQVNDAHHVWDPYTRQLYTNTSAFMRPLTFLFEVFGPLKILGQMLVAAVGTLTAVATTRIAMTLLPRRVAIAAGLVVALLPSQVLWSALLMKDAFSWTLLATAALVVLYFNRARGWQLLAWGAAVILTLTLIRYIREHTFLIATWSFFIAVLFSAPGARLIRAASAAIVGFVLPWWLGFGPGGYDFVTNVGSLEQERIQNSLGAATGIVIPEEEPRAVRVSQNGTSPGSVGSDGMSVKQRERGGATPDAPASDGMSVKQRERGGATPDAPDAPASDPSAPPEVAVPPLEREGTLSPDLAHLPRGLSVTLLEPYPWQRATSQSFRYAAMESVIWYPILIVALIGLVGAFRKLVAMAYPLAVGGGLILVMALTEGNVGTAFRHRSELVWMVALLFGFGVATITRRFDRRPGSRGRS